MSKLSIIFYCEGHFLDENSTLITAIATAFIGAFTLALWMTTSDQLRHARRVERAYVTMSHHSRMGNPGLKIDPGAGTVAVRIGVRNYGRTPADVTDVFLALAFDALPPPHSYVLPPGHQQTRAFLVTQSDFNYHRTFDGLDSNDLFAVMEDEGEKRKLWLYGYVDYRDSFGTRHRGGYMRRYERFNRMGTPDALGQLPERKNNLVFDPTLEFNFDRRRRRGEGNDWGESEPN